MKSIVISGYYGFANTGDEAMLTAIIKALRAWEEEPALTVISGNPVATQSKYAVRSVHRFSFGKIASALRKSDLLLSGGGSLLQDVTSRRSLYYYLFVLGMGLLLGKKVMLFAQGIGPVRSGFSRFLTRLVCSRADLITVRDNDSLRELEALGIPSDKVRLTADAVLTLPLEDAHAGEVLLREAGVPCSKRLIAISVRNWQGDAACLKQLAAAADTLVRQYDAHIVLLPLQDPIDATACERLQALMREKAASTVLFPGCDTEQILSLMANFDLLIGMRLHALIFAAVMGLPFVAVSYDPKIDAFVKEIDGISAGTVDSLQAGHVVLAAERAWSRKGDNMRLTELRQKASQNAILAWGLIHS